jgi:hypothetical protein
LTIYSDWSDQKLSTLAGARWNNLGLSLVVIKLLILIILAFNTRLVMDEFWHLHQTYYLFNGFFDDIWPEKAILYTPYFKLSAFLSWDAVSQIVAARGLSAALAIGLVGVVYATTRAVGYSPLAALSVALVLLCFNNFIERSFRVQSEPQAILLAAIALWIVVRGPMEHLRFIAFAGILSGLAFVTTQKSVYFNVALGAGLVLDALAQRSVKEAVRRSLALIGGWAAAVFAYSIAFGGWDGLALLRWTFVGPLEVAKSAQENYGNLRYYLYQTVEKNFILYIGCFVGLVYEVSRFRRLSPGARVHVVFTLVISVLVFSHNQPWPYVFNMALPFLALYAVAFFSTFGTTSARRTFVLIMFTGTVLFSFVRNVSYFDHDNRQQLAVVRAAEAHVPLGSSYFDGTGMLPNRAMLPYLWLDAMGVRKTMDAGETSPMLRGLRQTPPAVIIESYRTDDLASLLQPIFGDSYVQVSLNLRVPGVRLLPNEPQGLSVLTGEMFVARDDRGRLIDDIIIDGQIRTLPIRLDAGRYILQIDLKGPVWVVPERLDPQLVVPVIERIDLFDGVYE